MNALMSQALEEAEQAANECEAATFQFLLAVNKLEEKMAAVSAALVVERAQAEEGR